MINPADLATIHAAIIKNIPPAERPTANAIFNISVHAIGLLERFVVAHEAIAIELAKANKDA